MKKYFNGEGTITGWQGIGRIFVALIVYGIGLGLANALGNNKPLAALFIIPTVVFYIWLLFSTAMKRIQAFGWKGRWYNLLFPHLTDATYPNGKEKEEL